MCCEQQRQRRSCPRSGPHQNYRRPLLFLHACFTKFVLSLSISQATVRIYTCVFVCVFAFFCSCFPSEFCLVLSDILIPCYLAPCWIHTLPEANCVLLPLFLFEPWGTRKGEMKNENRSQIPRNTTHLAQNYACLIWPKIDREQVFVSLPCDRLSTCISHQYSALLLFVTLASRRVHCPPPRLIHISSIVTYTRLFSFFVSVSVELQREKAV